MQSDYANYNDGCTCQKCETARNMLMTNDEISKLQYDLRHTFGAFERLEIQKKIDKYEKILFDIANNTEVLI